MFGKIFSQNSLTAIKHMTEAPSSIVAFVSKLSIPKCVQIKTCDVYTRLDLLSSPRKSKVKILCYCIHQAYIECKMGVVDPCMIAVKLGISSIQATACVNNKPKYKAGFKPSSPTVKPVDMLISYIKGVLCLPDNIRATMVSLFDRVITTNPVLMSRQIKPLVAAFIICYMLDNGFDFCKDSMAELFYLKYSTIRPRISEVNTAIATC